MGENSITEVGMNMKFRVEIRPDGGRVWLAGGGYLADKTVLMGPPRSGKTTFLHLLFSLLTPDSEESQDVAYSVADNLLEPGGFFELEAGDFHISCHRTDGEGDSIICSRNRKPRAEDVLIFYEGVELTLKQPRAVNPVFMRMLQRMERYADRARGLFRYALVRREDGRWYEIVGIKPLALEHASSAVAVVGFLERLAEVFDGWILLDGTLDSLYPEESLYAAARLLASGARVVVSTHSPWVKDLFLCAPATLRLAGLKPRRVSVVTYEVVGGEFKRVDFSDYGATYSKLYEACNNEAR
jgi:energy-coupling factor transporter ATP-binding protein EcfA2